MEKERTNKNVLGYKYFRFIDDTDNFELLRVIKIYNNDQIMVEKDGTKFKTSISGLTDTGWRPIKPDGIVTASIVKFGDSKDVIVTMIKRNDVGLRDLPAVVCRQSITDIFYNLLTQTENNPYVGLSVSQRDCPGNFKFRDFLVIEDIIFTQVANIYRDDNLSDLLNLLNLPKFDEVLYKLFEEHIAAIQQPTAIYKRAVDGWCKNLNTLLESNNFWLDVDQELDVAMVNFDVDKYLVEKEDPTGESYQSLNQEATTFFCQTYKLNIVDTIVESWGYDIDLSEFSHSNYMVIKSTVTGKTYFMVYIVNGTYVELDLEKIKEQNDIRSKLGLAVSNSKYE